MIKLTSANIIFTKKEDKFVFINIEDSSSQMYTIEGQLFSWFEYTQSQSDHGLKLLELVTLFFKNNKDVNLKLLQSDIGRMINSGVLIDDGSIIKANLLDHSQFNILSLEAMEIHAVCLSDGFDSVYGSACRGPGPSSIVPV